MSKSLIEEEPPDDEEPNEPEPVVSAPESASEQGVRLMTVGVTTFTIPDFTGNQALTLSATPTELSAADAQRAREHADTAGVRLRAL